ncbi:MAG: hypothetical protein RLP44_20505 [Aggregatilineales bacterium]
MKKCGLMLILLLMLMLPVMPSTLAQDDDALTDEDLALIEYVSDSFDKLTAMNSVYTSGTGSASSNIRTERESFRLEGTVDFSGWTLFEDQVAYALNLNFSSESTMFLSAGQRFDMTILTTLRWVDDVLYMRMVDDASETITPQSLLNDWIDLTNSDEIFFSSGNLPMLDLMLHAGMGNIYNETSISHINELPQEILDNGIEARVFSVELDASAVATDDSMIRVSEGFNINTIIVEELSLLEKLMEGATYTTTLWVNTDTDIVEQVETDLQYATVSDVGGNILEDESQSLYLLRYSHFNEAFEITAPDLDDQ